MFCMMRRMICFALVLMMSLSLACPVLAATNSPSNTPTYTPPTDIPKTGDQIMMYVIIMVIALLALMAVVVLSRKAFRK